MIRNFLKRKDPFEFDANLKKKFLEILIKLTKIHQKKCKNYYKIIKKIKFKKTSTIEDLPFLPSSIFKEIELYSMRRKKIFKTLKSSGTSGQNVSKILFYSF